MSSYSLPEFSLDKNGLSVNVQPGYRLSLTSWENDADDFRTVVLSGLTKEDVEFYLNLAHIFHMDSPEHKASGGVNGMGNDEAIPSDLYILVKEMLALHPFISDKEKKIWEPLVEVEPTGDKNKRGSGGKLYGVLCDRVLSWPVQYEYGFCRMFDTYEVLEIESPVVLNVQVNDMTAEFKPSLGHSEKPARPKF